MPSIYSPTYKDISKLCFKKKVLVVGKGPTYGKRYNFSPDEYSFIGLNNVDGCEFNHIIDWNCMDFTKRNIITPFYPLLDGKPYQTLVPARPNIFFYNFYTAKQRHGETPVITNDSFSIHCVIEILHFHGITKFTSVGIGGGPQYGNTFQGTPKPREGGYDAQERGIEERLTKFGMEMERL